jgi:hypothetical protein
MNKRFFILLAVLVGSLLVVSGCGSSTPAAASPTAAVVSESMMVTGTSRPDATDTPLPTATVTPAPPTATATITPTETPAVVVSPEDLGMLFSDMLLVRYNAGVMDLAANMVLAGDMAEQDATRVLVSTIRLVDTIAPEIEVDSYPTDLANSWGNLLDLHAQVKDLHARWADGTIGTTEAAVQIESLLASIDQVLDGTVEALSGRYGLDRAKLESDRQANLDTIATTFTPIN